jgi:hypothetical protein
MTQDVKQWLAEIKALQQKLAEVQQERDEAYASATNWRNLYETEAKQRRTEAHLARQALDALKAEIQEGRISLTTAADAAAPENLTAIQQVVDQLQIDEMKDWLTQVLLERDRLTRALQSEQVAHTETRKNLTTALGDAVNILSKERADDHSNPASAPAANASNPDAAGGSASKQPDSKTPSLELPQFD